MGTSTKTNEHYFLRWMTIMAMHTKVAFKTLRHVIIVYASIKIHMLLFIHSAVSDFLRPQGLRPM